MNDQGGGPFDRYNGEDGGQRDRTAQFILIGMGVVGLVLFILVASPFSIFGGGDDDEGGLPSNGGSGEQVSGVPEGLDALSKHYEDLEPPRDTNPPYVLTLPLLEPITDGRNLGLYTLVDGNWERVASAELVNNGTAARGEVAQMPGNLAVLRLTASAFQVTGWLPAGSQPDPEGLNTVTALNPVDYAPQPDGTIAGTATELPAANGDIVPTVRAATPEDDEAVNTVLASPALREEHITALVNLALQPGNAGVDIDYPRVSPTRKADFTAFISTLADRLHQANRTLSVTLPSPVRTGVSWDTGAYDWPALAGRADLLKLASEPDPTLFYESTTAVLDYLQGQVDLKKVALVVGRHSYEKATDGLVPMTLYDALTLATAIEVRTTSQITPNSSVVLVGRNIFEDDGASGVHWDEQARSVAFDYAGRGGTRTVYIENSISLGFKLDLARQYGLGGVAVTDISNNPGLPAVWAPLRSYGETGSVQLVQPNDVLLRPTWEVQAGQSNAESEGNLVWTAPTQPGNYDVTLVISDGVIRAAQKIVLTVQAPAP